MRLLIRSVGNRGYCAPVPGAKHVGVTRSDLRTRRHRTEVETSRYSHRQSRDDTGAASTIMTDTYTSTLPQAGLSLSTVLSKGATIGRYVVLGKLGEGGMGVVYAAYDPELDRKVAIKLLHASTEQDGSVGRTRLLREAQAMAKLSHPNVVSVYDVGTIGEQVFIAMEFVDGGTLTEWLTRERRSRNEILAKFIDAGRGLEAAHRVGLVHRDFKPDNVLIGKDGRARVTDFGIAMLSSRSVPMDQEGALVGTPSYMSPEQFRSEPVGAQSDQFSFCVALYEALHGQQPFGGTTLGSRCLNVIKGTIEPLPETQAKQVPMWLRLHVLRGLRTDPHARHLDMSALLSALSRDEDRQRLRIFGLVAAAIFMIGLGGLLARGLRKQPGSQCKGASARIVGIWNPARKEAAEKALIATGRRYAKEVFSRVQAELDSYLHGVAAAQVDACEATYVRGVQSQATLDLRMRCLDRRLSEVTALVDQLLSASEATIDQLGGTGRELTPIASCADVAALSAPVPLPEKESDRRQVEKLQERLIALRIAERVGQYSKVLPDAKRIVEDIKSTGYSPLQAEAQVLLADLLVLSGDKAAAEQALFQAVAAAVRGRDHHRAAQSWTLLMFLAIERRDFESAQHWEWMARAELDQTTGADEVKGQLFNNLCVLGQRKRTFADAIPFCEQALVYRRKYFGPNHPKVASILSNESLIYKSMGKIDKSLELAYQAYRIETEALGSFHPKIAWALITISSTLRAQKNFEKSDESLNQAIRIYQNSFDKPNAATASAIALLAHSKIEQKKFDEAQALAQQALMIRTAALGPQSGEVASSKNLLGRLARRRAQFTDALKLHSEALQIYEKRRNNDGIINSLIGMANSLTELHKPKLALPLIDRADGLRSGSGSPDQEADCQFSRAQALYAMPKSKAQHQQVRKLIDSARATYVRLGSSSRTDLELIDEWLKSKDLGPSEPQTAPLARP